MQNQLELFAFTVWGIWTQRNRTRVQQPGCSLQHLVQESKGRLAEFLDISSLPQPRPPLPRAQWKPPPTGLVKINFDGAVFSNVNKSRVDVVARDCNGLILASTSQ
uniref:RNase H type-1 domain-containing protein n=1 Tax=Quercus lobata TaxID=97700 RepID=A0A7N2N1Z7_QUELO